MKTRSPGHNATDLRRVSTKITIKPVAPDHLTIQALLQTHDPPLPVSQAHGDATIVNGSVHGLGRVIHEGRPAHLGPGLRCHVGSLF